MWPYTPDARWHLFAFEVDAAAFDKLRADLRAPLLWGTPPVDLTAAVRACLPASPVDVGLGAAYEDVGPAARMMYDGVDPFAPEDLLLPRALVDTSWPVHADMRLWDDELGPVTYASGDELVHAAAELEAWPGGDDDDEDEDDEDGADLGPLFGALATRYREVAARGGTLISFVARNPRS